MSRTAKEDAIEHDKRTNHPGNMDRAKRFIGMLRARAAYEQHKSTEKEWEEAIANCDRTMPVGPTRFLKEGGMAEFSRYPWDHSIRIYVSGRGFSGGGLTATSVLEHAGPPDEGCVWVKDYSENEGMWDALIKAGVIESTYRTARQGFVVFKEGRLLPRAAAALAKWDEMFKNRTSSV